MSFVLRCVVTLRYFVVSLWLPVPSGDQIGIVCDRQAPQVTDILLLSSPRLVTGVFFSPSTSDNGRMTQPAAFSISMLVAAKTFVEFEHTRTPDFSSCIVLVPHHPAGQDFRRALRHVLPEPTLRPPRLLTLPELARTATSASSPQADSSRIAELQQFLLRTGHLQTSGLWQAAQELHNLLNELDMANAALDGTTLVTHQANAQLGIEASIAQAVWRAYGNTSTSRVGAYLSGLMQLAATTNQPLYHVGLMGLSRAEQVFFEVWQQRQAVHELPAPTPHAARHALLHTIWQDHSAPLATRALNSALNAVSSPLSGKIGILAAPGLEAAALAAEQQLMTWLAQGRQRIALIALDRLLARRLRALLERREILVQDETGWAFSTSAVSHVVERWLGIANGRVWHADLLDLLKSPFVFTNQPDTVRLAVHQLTQALRNHGAPSSFAGFVAFAKETGCSAAIPLLQRLETSSKRFSARRLALNEWNLQLLAALEDMEATAALNTDPIGTQLLALLSRLTEETRDLSQTFSFSDWQRWLFLHLEQGTFIDTRVESPIRLTHLAAAHHRDLEGVLILGAGAAHLPGHSTITVFNNTTLRQLGLPDAQAKERLAQDMLMDILARSPETGLVWQSESGGNPAPLSPWLVHLNAFHLAAWGRSLVQVVPSPGNTSEPIAPASHNPAEIQHAPVRLSVSAWQSLVNCPYQFFGRYILGLNEQDETPEEMDKAEYGSLLHLILAEFHDTYTTLNGTPADEWVRRLTLRSETTFKPIIARDYQASAWLQRWLRHVPAYIDWAIEHETSGWHFHAAEVPLHRTINWAAGKETVLHGRADRIDKKGEASIVLDYKTQSTSTLKAKLEPHGEDVQLAVYALMSEAEQAGFVSMDSDKVRTMSPDLKDPPLSERALAESERIATTLYALAHGQALAAHGAEQTCLWCEMQGLCRRAHRETPTAI